jgi:hypothetical protein
MRYTVIWTPTAINKLAAIWITAPDPQAVSTACNRIDRELAVDPDQKASPLAAGDWYYCDLPLAVVFTIDPGDCKVEVVNVWHQ